MNVEQATGRLTSLERKAFSRLRGHDTDKLLGCDLEVGHVTQTIPVFLQLNMRMTVPWLPPSFWDMVAAVGMEEQPLTTTGIDEWRLLLCELLTTMGKDGWRLLQCELLRGFSLPLNLTFLCHGPKLSDSRSQKRSLLFTHGKSDRQSNRRYLSLIGTLDWPQGKPDFARY